MEEQGVELFKVYARYNKSTLKVDEIYSSCFKNKGVDDIFIKEGLGDEFVHVGYYQIYDENMCHNYKIENGEFIECTKEEKRVEQEEQEKNKPLSENEILQQQIADMEIQILDYIN